MYIIILIILTYNILIIKVLRAGTVPPNLKKKTDKQLIGPICRKNYTFSSNVEKTYNPGL